MIKTPLQDSQMSSAAFVEEAKGYARHLVQAESRGPGDTDNAMRRIETKYGVPYWTLWALRYRVPKDITIGVFHAVKNAYLAECGRQERRYAHERQMIEAKNAAAAALVRASDIVVGKANEPPNKEGSQ